MAQIWHEIIVSYDISENKKRTKFYNFLLDLGLMPIQKSLFWGRVLIPEIKDIQNKIAINEFKFHEDDKILITRIDIENSLSYIYGVNMDVFKKGNVFYV